MVQVKAPGTHGLLRARWLLYLLLWSLVGILFSLVYQVASRVVVNEIRYHARGVAIATAAGIDVDSLGQIHAPADMDTPAYRQIQEFLSGIARYNPDVRYIYTMRRSMRGEAGPADFEFIVDQASQDEDGNGVIDRAESSEPPGKPYDASQYPEMIKSWQVPSADWDVSPDPPYPDLMTGYAPIRDALGRTVAIVGVDVVAATIQQKLRALQVSMTLAGVLLAVMMSAIAHMYLSQRRLVRERDNLIGSLQEVRSNVQTLHGLLPICAACKNVRNDRGYWEQIEKYLGDHTQAEFTHGICPECTRKLYQEFYDRHPSPPEQ